MPKRPAEVKPKEDLSLRENADAKRRASAPARGDAIVGLFNTSGQAQKVSIRASAVGLPGNKRGYSAKNLWTGKRQKEGAEISATVPSHGVVLYRVKVL